MPYIDRNSAGQISLAYSVQENAGQEFIDPNAAEYLAFIAKTSAQSELSCTPLQARLALLNAGLLDQVNAYITTLTQPQQLAWEYATVIQESNEVVQGAAAQMKLTQDQVDALFKAAQLL